MNEKEKKLIEKYRTRVLHWIEYYEIKMPYPNKFAQTIAVDVMEAIRNAVAEREKQVMEKYNSIGRVVEESSKIQLDKWEEAIRMKRDEEIVKGIMDQRISFVGKDLYLEGYHKAITNILKLMPKEILSKMGIAVKGQKEGQE